MLRKKDFFGFAHRCAERLCLSGCRSLKFCGYAANVRRSLTELGIKLNGKAQPFRTSGGTAAVLRNISYKESILAGKAACAPTLNKP